MNKPQQRQPKVSAKKQFIELVNVLEALREAEARQAQAAFGITVLTLKVLQRRDYILTVRPREGNHTIPHFHVEAPNFSDSYRIDNGESLIKRSNHKPTKRIEREIQQWAECHRAMLMQVWNRSRPTQYTDSRQSLN